MGNQSCSYSRIIILPIKSINITQTTETTSIDSIIPVASRTSPRISRSCPPQTSGNISKNHKHLYSKVGRYSTAVPRGELHYNVSIGCRVDDDHEHAQASKFKIMVEFEIMVA